MEKKIAQRLLAVAAIGFSVDGTWAKSEGKDVSRQSEKAMQKAERQMSKAADDHDVNMKEKLKHQKPKKEKMEKYADDNMNNKEHKNNKHEAGMGMKNNADKPSGLAKQQENKAVQERKEAGKGAEQGQRMREEHSRKWWKFWD